MWGAESADPYSEPPQTSGAALDTARDRSISWESCPRGRNLGELGFLRWCGITSSGEPRVAVSRKMPKMGAVKPSPDAILGKAEKVLLQPDVAPPSTDRSRRWFYSDFFQNMYY
jgi:hypothetical protein